MDDGTINNDQWLTLSLSLPSPPTPPHSSQEDQKPAQPLMLPAAMTRRTKKATAKTKTIDPPPFPWATTKLATVHTLEHLLANKISSITGTVKCRSCQKQYEMDFDLEGKFREVARFVIKKNRDTHDRAPSSWMAPVLPNCEFCNGKNTAVPVIAAKKRNINWLFLFLGQMIGCCKLSQLKYFCKHADIHLTGAKDRLVYYIYLGLCKQLKPQGPFDLFKKV
ncbi:hypothetical protein HN51_015697 [Arachis hypogaea]|uniref:DUF7086 domain-containing protein n=4 Tax=Arachis hypogaea TaxID=3818 RepID=A0A445CJD9_ARAHY|nr:uncharacterized protein DS421_6g185250 [Arachis hypogaea]RYR51028.1 hypothetical protein Ahy_A06g026083 isoform A [Arachis hypogaea]